MKRSVLLFLLLAACDSGPRIVVHASLGGHPVGDLPLTLLPYDRQRLQDSIRRADADDAPELPQDLLRELAGMDSALARAATDSSALARRDSLRTRRNRLVARVDSARARVAAWDAGLVARADSFGQEGADAADREIASDTTDDAGRAALAATPGSAWIRASYVLPDAVVEWNVEVTLPAGQDSLVVQLDDRNARRLPLAATSGVAP